jgi:hypothetical protein
MQGEGRGILEQIVAHLELGWHGPTSVSQSISRVPPTYRNSLFNADICTKQTSCFYLRIGLRVGLRVRR